MANDNKDFSFEISKHIATLSTNPVSGWSRELNLVSWRGRPPKFDLREWDENHQKMSKGMTLNKEEAKILCESIEKELQG